MGKKLSVLLLYHFFSPDDVAGAFHFSQLAEELVKRNWEVTALTSNRYCRYRNRKITKKIESWHGINIIRCRRPGWNQANKYLRLANSLWMMIAWILKIRKLPEADAIILGSDPQFAALLFPILRFLKNRALLVHWCYDLFPEAIIAEGTNAFTGLIVRVASSMMRQAYRYVDLMVDIGSCMRTRLASYNGHFNFATLVPWALVEPETIQQPDAGTRAELFNDASLTLLYSGNLGRAHDFSLFLNLARRLRKEDPKIVFCFACRGNRYSELIKAVTPEDINICFAPFAESKELEKRLNSADIHLLSLRPGWEGIVVPSKFFGSLAAGRPIIYAGPERSAIGEWIRKYNIGLVLNKHNLDDIVKQLLNLRNNSQKLAVWQENAFKTYHKYFSKNIVVDRWDEILRKSLSKVTNQPKT